MLAVDLETGFQQAVDHFQSGRFADAEVIYRDILRVHPDLEIVINELGRTCQKQGKYVDAIALFRRLVELRPDLPMAYKNLGIALCEAGEFEQSFSVFKRHAEMTHEKYESELHSTPSVPPHKFKHDQEQQDYLAAQIGATNASVFHAGDGSRVAGRALNPAATDIAGQWQNNHPQLVVVDNLLTPDALRKLQSYCWETTMWRQIYQTGYLGAFPEYGFGSPLMAQIIQELRVTYPTIFADHPLRQFWGFKYDSNLNGIALHADFATVNVNFWITPDEANLDSENGGLVVWDVAAPPDWNFDKYNEDVGAMRAYLKDAGAKAINVPYRCNRAVIFNSNLFHETGKIVFKDGYLNRRINITFLFGGRKSPNA